MERPPEVKNYEQYPLLKVDSGSGDGNRQPPTSDAARWTVTCVPKRCWLNRCPEFISTCWMTLSLLGVSLIIFYALTMGAYRRPPLLLLKCNDTKPANQVFLHQIIRGNLPFVLCSQFLSTMALQYPSLHFNVYFLKDDSMRYYEPPHSRLINNWLYQNTFRDVSEGTKQEIVEFQKRYPNVNVTIMTLCKYMSFTPLRFKWRSVSLSYLNFYLRTFVVWQYGGIGMDLTTYNNLYSTRIHLDRRVDAILKNHNDGFPSNNYNKVLNAINQEDEKCLFCVMNQLFNDTLSMFLNMFSTNEVSSENMELPFTPVKRLHRSKRDVSEDVDMKTNLKSLSGNATEDNVGNKNNTNISMVNENSSLPNAIEGNSTSVNTTNRNDKLKIAQKPYGGGTLKISKSKTNFGIPQVVLFYDYSLLSDNLGSLLQQSIFPMNHAGQDNKDKHKGRKAANSTRLAINYDGSFISAMDKFHPFLGNLLAANGQRLQPEFVIRETLANLCSGLYQDMSYCNVYEL